MCVMPRRAKNPHPFITPTGDSTFPTPYLVVVFERLLAPEPGSRCYACGRWQKTDMSLTRSIMPVTPKSPKICSHIVFQLFWLTKGGMYYLTNLAFDNASYISTFPFIFHCNSELLPGVWYVCSFFFLDFNLPPANRNLFIPASVHSHSNFQRTQPSSMPVVNPRFYIWLRSRKDFGGLSES
jgi:hypothetical protein